MHGDLKDPCEKRLNQVKRLTLILEELNSKQVDNPAYLFWKIQCRLLKLANQLLKYNRIAMHAKTH